MDVKARVHPAAVSPWDKGQPAIHGPDIYGASPGKPFSYTIPATGERPVKFHAEGLPEGLHLEADSGRINGTVRREGDVRVMLRVENMHGKAEKELVIAIGGCLACTPPLGWNSWRAWAHWVDDAQVRSAADRLVSTGLAARGYSYVNIDSCWQGIRGGKHNAIQPNSKFPDMARLVNYVHSMGLKFGIYSSPWTLPQGCSEKLAAEAWGGTGLIGCSSGPPDPAYPNSRGDGHYVGINKHEAEDVAQWTEWGVDFLKYDWNPFDPDSLERMGRLLKNAERDIILSLCTIARLKHVDAYKTWTHMWRGLPDDSQDDWSSVVKNAFTSEDYLGEDWRPHIGPGAWYDLDLLALGPQFHTRTSNRMNRLTEDEQITHMTAWALYPSPIILSCDLASMSDFELRLFANEEVLAVNQDRLGKPAIRFTEKRRQSPGSVKPLHNARIWARPLADGDFAVGLFNLADHADELTFDAKSLGLPDDSVAVRNLWERRDIGRMQGRISVPVPAHGAQLLKITP